MAFRNVSRKIWILEMAVIKSVLSFVLISKLFIYFEILKDRNQEWLLEKRDNEMMSNNGKSNTGGYKNNDTERRRRSSGGLIDNAETDGIEPTLGDNESEPEWFSDGIPIINDKEHEMTFDEDGQYVLARELTDDENDENDTSKKPASHTMSGLTLPVAAANASHSNTDTSDGLNPNALGIHKTNSFEMLVQNHQHHHNKA